MTKVFGGDHKNISAFQITHTDQPAVNREGGEGNVVNQSEALNIPKVLSVQEEKTRAEIEKFSENIEHNVVDAVKQDIQKDAANYSFFKETFAELEKIRKDAEKKGYQAGLQQGKKEGLLQGKQEGLKTAQKEGDERYKSKLEVLSESIGKVYALNQQIIETAKGDAIELGVMIAQKIVQTEITLKPKLFLNIIEAALKTMVAGKHVEIFLNQNDFALIKEIPFTYPGINEISIAGDNDLKEGEIRINSDVENLAFSLSEMFKKHYNELKEG